MSVATAIVVSCLATLVVVTPGAAAQQVAPFHNLRLEIKASPTSILPMQAVRLHIRLTNPSERPVAGHASIQPAAGLLTLQIAAPGEAPRKVHPFCEPHADAMAGNRQLPAGFEASHLTYLWWGEMDGGRYGACFPLPGRYSIKAVLANLGGEGTIESNVATIAVTQPGPRDSRAWQFLREQATGHQPFPFALSDRWTDPREPMLKELLVWFPNSTYATYARYALGMRYRLIAKHAAVAAPLLEQVVVHTDFPFRDQVLYDLVRIYLGSGAARRHLATLKADYPDTEWARDAERLVTEAEAR